MTKTVTKALALLMLTSLTACDRGLTQAQLDERSESRYQKAMAEYKAGNLERAVRELEDVLRASPGNLSARFLLASLQQERKDSVGAFCNFREFTLLSPAGEKADMARQRMALCEEALAKELATKMKLTGNAAIARESASARKDLQDAEKAQARLSGALEAAQRKVAALERENARLRRMVAAVGGEEPEETRRVENVRDILDDDGDEARAPRVAPPDLDDEASAAPTTDLAAAKALAADAESEKGPVALQGANGASSSKKLSEMAGGFSLGHGRSRASKDADSAREKRPDSYVVQEGDTLYKIALRFYGNQNHWRRIREANKATISNDGRVKAGERIILP